MGGSGGEDDGFRFINLLLGDELFDASLELHLKNRIIDNFHPQAGGMTVQVLDKIESRNAGDAGIVVHVGGIDDLTAVEAAFDDLNAESGADTVNRGGKAGGSGS